MRWTPRETYFPIKRVRVLKSFLKHWKYQCLLIKRYIVIPKDNYRIDRRQFRFLVENLCCWFSIELIATKDPCHYDSPPKWRRQTQPISKRILIHQVPSSQSTIEWKFSSDLAAVLRVRRKRANYGLKIENLYRGYCEKWTRTPLLV